MLTSPLVAPLPAGSPVSAYGTESRNRSARQRIPHRLYNDSEGREHVQLQFHLKGPSGRALVNADMYQDGGQWRYNFLYLNVESPIPQQVPACCCLPFLPCDAYMCHLLHNQKQLN